MTHSIQSHQLPRDDQYDVDQTSSVVDDGAAIERALWTCPLSPDGECKHCMPGTIFSLVLQ